LTKRQGAQSRKWVHWRHCGCAGVGVGCVVCSQGFRRGEVAFSISISNWNSRSGIGQNFTIAPCTLTSFRRITLTFEINANIKCM
jgi:hypothetical protein